MKKLLLIEILLTISFTLMAEDPAKTYKNPVVNYSLPDPSVIRAEDGYIDASMKISTRGKYTFAIRNNSDVEVRTTGYVNY